MSFEVRKGGLWVWPFSFVLVLGQLAFLAKCKKWELDGLKIIFSALFITLSSIFALLAHEVGHILSAVACGYEDLVLYIGPAEWQVYIPNFFSTSAPRAAIWISGAGPGVSLLILILIRIVSGSVRGYLQLGLLILFLNEFFCGFCTLLEPSAADAQIFLQGLVTLYRLSEKTVATVQLFCLFFLGCLVVVTFYKGLENAAFE